MPRVQAEVAFETGDLQPAVDYFAMDVDNDEDMVDQEETIAQRR